MRSPFTSMVPSLVRRRRPCGSQAARQRWSRLSGDAKLAVMRAARRSAKLAKRRAANRRNALRSTGPRTAAGKARSALNGRRHGLTLPVAADLRYAPLISELVNAIAGPEKSAACREYALRVALPWADLIRIRHAKTKMMAEELTPRAVKRLASLARYEERAFSRRKFAIRAFDAGRLVNFSQNEPVGDFGQHEATGAETKARSTASRRFPKLPMGPVERRARRLLRFRPRRSQLMRMINYLNRLNRFHGLGNASAPGWRMLT